MDELSQGSFDLACMAYDNGLLKEARSQYQHLINLHPNYPPLRYNLGLVYFQQAEFVQALNEFSIAAIYEPEDIDTLYNLALCQKKIGDYTAAIDTHVRILNQEPNHFDSLFSLGNCYRDQYEDEQAIACYLRTLTLQPAFMPAIANLAAVHHRGGDYDLAIGYYKQVLQKQPQDESIGYILAALQGVPLDHAPDSYIHDVFNSYANDFEHNLVVELGYNNPQQLYDCFIRSNASKERCLHGLDLGCGTGLGGLVFQKMVETLDGVDLSENMIDQAFGKGCYTQIHHNSIVQHLTTTDETYDFFLATDVFIYAGDLVPIFTLARAVATDHALFCFSTEHLNGTLYSLQPSGRFAYSTGYIRQAASETGWDILSYESAPLRWEYDEWLNGDLWILRLLTPEPQA
ncbi:tetratricopeptide repeat protein [Desulfobulbus rhabdoformis]|uniref:tetratricopeptide repeat protein n=1 Tax=Desulfobulbus rhabdoformis TaxID=34032 RepID=UPI001963D1CB|nr:tetratricopeptide repeat protein [Desulfobulbus rhabdoformis]MBM9615197.1 tetratricopeptide repeat protein [Desulfobulbus rhabdoformis]